MEFYGLLGEKLSHSLSPEIHSELLKFINKDGAYKLFEVEKERLEEFTEALKLLKIKGTNVTIPYKKDIMKYIDKISEEAEKIGAINTIALENGKLYGYNTDYYGFGYMLKVNNISIEGKSAVILGNGGACRAVTHYLLDNKISNVKIVSRKPKKEEFDLQNVDLITYEELKEISGDILINSTPVGMYPDINVSPVSEDVVKNFNVLVDLIYNPMETKFLNVGNSLSKKTTCGLYMLIGQAAKAQEIWQGISIDEEIIKEIYEKLKLKFI
ncbi:shikimate dehydrogenase [Clostridium sp. DSM 100503]|uniref:shikimate dehydrogenase n=1 Tax=Clostridium sp. DSM 100503 TaxID=2963282 RepID=UPI00214A3D46|nr:shikimate dehydrogenase [Clostridium sp. DSM 100503]MCR1952460.1 shikimate dehydrogenase [Clostridium sp. DSM 100503]